MSQIPVGAPNPSAPSQPKVSDCVAPKPISDTFSVNNMFDSIESYFFPSGKRSSFGSRIRSEARFYLPSISPPPTPTCCYTVTHPLTLLPIWGICKWWSWLIKLSLPVLLEPCPCLRNPPGTKWEFLLVGGNKLRWAQEATVPKAICQHPQTEKNWTSSKRS